MTDQQLAEIKGRTDAATPGPWYSGEQPYTGDVKHTAEYITKPEDANWQFAPGHDVGGWCCIAETNSNLDGEGGYDAAFIAHARTDVPALVAEVERLRARQAAQE